MTTRDLILQELEQVPEVILRAVLDFLRLLKQGYAKTKEENLFGQYAGILSNEEADSIQAVIAEEFERVDLNEW